MPSDQDVLPEAFWVVVPAFNEETRIGRVLDELAGRCANIVVVDDASTDATREEVLRRPVWLLQHFINLGQGAALQTGITFALQQGAEYIATFDADGQHAVDDLQVLLEPLVTGKAEYALGSRFLGGARGIPFFRAVVLKLGVLFTYLLYGIRLTDAHNGARAMTRRGAERLNITLDRMEHASQVLQQIKSSGLKYCEVPVHINYTRETLVKGQRSTAALKMGFRLLLERMVS